MSGKYTDLDDLDEYDQRKLWEEATLGGFVNPAADWCDPEDIAPISDGWEDPELQ